jgi:hypothetical protein
MLPDIRADLEQILFTANLYSRNFVNSFNGALTPMTPIEIVIVTIASIMMINFVAEKLSAWYKIGFKTLVFRIACKLPIISTKVAGEL